MFNKTCFNKTYVDNSYTSPSTVKVEEKKAPTDESIRLLNEFTEKALDNIISCKQLNTNELRDITWWTYYDTMSFNNKLICKFKLNDTDYTFDVNSCEVRYKTQEEIQDHMLNTVIKFLAKKLLHAAGSAENFREVHEFIKHRRD
jgi:hypothetical protein